MPTEPSTQFTINLTLTRDGVKVLVVKPDGMATSYSRKNEFDALEAVRKTVLDALQSHRDYGIY